MKAFKLSLLVLCIGGVAATLAQAQWYVDNQASTVGESYARGMSDVVRAQGQYNLDTSQAAINATQAQSNEMKNYEQWTNTYFQTRAANKAYREAEAGPRPTSEDFVRWAKEGAPQPLGPSQYDPITGKINWPVALKTDGYAKYRSQLDEIFAKRASNDSLTLDDFMEVDKITQSMMNDLKSQIRNIPPDLYVGSKEFLKSLAYEVRRPS